MHVHITEAATKRIQEKVDTDIGLLRIHYETEGCGCVMSGVPVLQWVEKAKTGDVQMNSDATFPIHMEKEKLVFFAEKMKIDISTKGTLFRLSSPQQILNGQMNFEVE